MCREHFLPLDDLVDQSGAGVVRAISVDPESVDPAGDEADIKVPLGVTRESTSGQLPSLLPWTNGQCPRAARRKLTDHAVLVSF